MKSWMTSCTSFALSLGLLAVASACAEDRPVLPSTVSARAGATSSFSSSGSNADQTPITPIKTALIMTSPFKITALHQDAVDFTFGAAKVTGFESSSGSSTERYLYVSEPSLLSAVQMDVLLPLCRDIAFTPGDENILTWRSHFPLAVKRLLAVLLQSGQTQILCVLRINDGGKSKYLAFDPIPTTPASVNGSAQPDKVVAQGLLNPQAISLSLTVKNLVGVQGNAVLLAGIKAIAGETVVLTPKDESGPSCYYDTSKPGSVVGNPDQLKKAILSMKVPLPVKVQGFIPVATGGRLIKSCEKIALASTPDTIQSSYSCQAYQDIKTEGLEAGCQWELEMANAADLQNSVAVPLKMGLLAFKTIDKTKAQDVLSLVPKDPQNPLRISPEIFTGFSDSQKAYATLAFDLWLAVYPKSYVDDFKGFMKNVVVSTTCDPGVGGFATINSTSFTWCAPNLTDAGNNPSRPVFHAILVAHETRHSRGWRHDVDVADYTPCQGSAASAAVMEAIVATCKEDYCAVLRNAAFNEYITELNYSLKADPRRFLGQCKAWSTAMGLTDQSITDAASK
ncbi:MAG: hypothetical protein H7249_06550 [Chitinophagaceae bacterium]|nr:hypothetical protein [Oligoflexus sp.]